MRIEGGQVEIGAVASALASVSPGNISARLEIDFKYYHKDPNGLSVGEDDPEQLAGSFIASHCPVLDLITNDAAVGNDAS